METESQRVKRLVLGAELELELFSMMLYFSLIFTFLLCIKATMPIVARLKREETQTSIKKKI